MLGLIWVELWLLWLLCCVCLMCVYIHYTSPPDSRHRRAGRIRYRARSPPPQQQHEPVTRPNKRANHMAIEMRSCFRKRLLHRFFAIWGLRSGHMALEAGARFIIQVARIAPRPALPYSRIFSMESSNQAVNQIIIHPFHTLSTSRSSLPSSLASSSASVESYRFDASSPFPRSARPRPLHHHPQLPLPFPNLALLRLCLCRPCCCCTTMSRAPMR